MPETNPQKFGDTSESAGGGSRKLKTGPRGGKYMILKGKKVYVPECKLKVSPKSK